jgi:AcrR family transcriptional regulator
MTEPSRKFRRVDPGLRREALIEAALRCLAREGHGGLSVRRIAAEAGVSVGLINHYFPSIDRLIADAYEILATGIADKMAAAAERAEGSPRERFARLIEASFAPDIMDPALLKVWVVFWGMILHSPAMRAVQKRNNDRFCGVFERFLRDVAEAEGRRVDTALLALGLSAMHDGLWLEFCLDPDSFKVEDGMALCHAWIDAKLG